MKRLLRTPVAILSLLAACAPPAELAIENVTIISGLDEPAYVGSVTVADGRFVEVLRGDGRPGRAAETIDGTGMFLLPGLWDMHVHVASSRDHEIDLAAFVRHSVTSVRDLGGFPEDVRDVAVSAEPGPTIDSALQMLNGEAFADFQRVVTTPAEVEAAVAELAASGARVIKVHRALSPELLPAVIEAAHAHELPVTGHIPLGMHPLAACEAGMDGVEHIGSFLEAWLSVNEAADTADAFEFMLSSQSRALIECLVERGVFVTATLVIYPAIAHRRASGEDLPQDFREFLAGTRHVVRRLHEVGVPLLAGTDTTDLMETLTLQAGSSLHDELALLQRSGIPPAAVLRIASANAARALKIDDEMGTVAPGRAADFLLVSQDPRVDVAVLRERMAVYRGGVRR